MADASAAKRAASVMERCETLAACTEEPGRITRSYGSPALTAARTSVAEWMRAAGMTVRTDAIGTLRGRYGGTDPDAPALLLGSHIDSVRDAGKYDGPLGVLVAIAAVERLAASDRRLPFPIEVIAFPDEEGLRFQTTYLGSSALAGTFEPDLLARVDAAGITMREAIAGFGGDPAALDRAPLQPNEAFAYVEVHIEQGPHLESIDAPLGVVTAISGQTRILASFLGVAGHAGTVAMNLRRDALPAAAELILAAESMAQSKPGLLATVGVIAAEPGASNVIPGKVDFTLDVRHPDDAVRRGAVHDLEQKARQVALERRLDVEWAVVRDHPAVACDADLANRLERVVVAAGHANDRLPSGAGHDAVVMAARLPVAMLFVRCAGGISHNPAEAVSMPDVAAAIATIDRFLDDLANEDAPARTVAGLARSSRQFDTIVRGGAVVLTDAVTVADVAVRDGVIVEVASEIVDSARQEIDARGLHVFPGAVDIHVHFNEPGRTDWEGWATGSAACAVGGTTTVVDMPLNASPPTLDGPSFDAKRAAAEASSLVDFALWGGLTPINLDRMAELAARGVVGFKAFMSNSGIDDFPRADDATLREGMQRAAALGLPVAVHAENEEMTASLAAQARAAGRTTFADYAATRPPEAELEAIGRAIRFAEEAGCALHVVHVSTAAGLSEINAARARGVDVTAETCPHYLWFSEDDFELLDSVGPLMKCAPPLRSYEESCQLGRAVARGEAQIVASDHSPCPDSMKWGEDFFEIWGGIAGCQSLLHATVGAIHQGQQAPLPFALNLISDAPASRLRLPGKGRIAPGFDADLVLVDLAEQFTLEPWHLRYRHKVSPYANFTFPAAVQRVLLRGRTIVLDNETLGPPRGRLLTPGA